MIELVGRAPDALATRGRAQFMRLVGLAARYVPGGGGTAINTLPFRRQQAHLRPGALCAHRRDPRGRAALGIGSPTVAWLDSAFRAMREFADPSYASRLRQPLLLVAAGQDQIVSTPATGASPCGCARARIW